VGEFVHGVLSISNQQPTTAVAVLPKIFREYSLVKKKTTVRTAVDRRPRKNRNLIHFTTKSIEILTVLMTNKVEYYILALMSLIDHHFMIFLSFHTRPISL
jgi:hypothetical protein